MAMTAWREIHLTSQNCKTENLQDSDKKETSLQDVKPICRNIPTDLSSRSSNCLDNSIFA